MPDKKKTVIIIAGPTAVGKTSLAIDLARHFHTEIISADSRQCYRELNIGVARPSAAELAAVKHYFIASHSIHQKVNAVTFENYALEKLNHIFQHHQVAVLVGGTGLYIKAFTEGMDLIPEVPGDLHQSVIHAYQQNGIEWLQQQVQQYDPGFYETGEIQNPQRLMRALEVVKATGQSILSFRKGEKVKRNFDVIKIALDLPKEALHRNINTRVDQMIERGLIEEVRSLIPYQQLNALQTVGYKELFDYFKGESTIDEAIELIKRNTRHYAKRQLTWFRKDKEYRWLPPISAEVLRFISVQYGL